MREKKEKKYEELLLEVRRVTRVTTGGRRLSFRATILVGNRNGAIGLGVAKSGDVAGAVNKATHDAYKNVFMVPVVGANTIPYAIDFKYKAARIKLLPAAAGTGLKAGSAVRSVLDLAGYNNMLSKIIGTNNKLNNALATIYGLSRIKAEVKNSTQIAQELKEIAQDAESEKRAKTEKKTKDSTPKSKSTVKKIGAPKAKQEVTEDKPAVETKETPKKIAPKKATPKKDSTKSEK